MRQTLVQLIKTGTIKFKNSIHSWYYGKMSRIDYQRSGDESIDNQLELLSMRIERHWSSNLFRKIAIFIRDHWMWLIGTFLAVLGIIVGL